MKRVILLTMFSIVLIGSIRLMSQDDQDLVTLPYPVHHNFYLDNISVMPRYNMAPEWKIMTDYPNEVMVYKEVHGPIQEGDFDSLIQECRMMGMRGNPQLQYFKNLNSYQIKFPSEGVVYRFRNNKRLFGVSYIKDYPLVMPFGMKSSYEERLKALLDLLESHNLSEKDIYATHFMYNTGKFEPGLNTYAVNFFRRINDLKVIGEGRIHVTSHYDKNLGKYAVHFYFHFMRDWEPYKKYPIKSPKEAWAEFLKGWGSFHIPPSDNMPEDSIRKAQKDIPIGITLKRMFLAYYEADSSVVQEYLEPVYVFDFYMGYALVPAIKDSYVDLHPKKIKYLERNEKENLKE